MKVQVEEVEVTTKHNALYEVSTEDGIGYVADWGVIVTDIEGRSWVHVTATIPGITQDEEGVPCVVARPPADLERLANRIRNRGIIDTLYWDRL